MSFENDFSMRSIFFLKAFLAVFILVLLGESAGAQTITLGPDVIGENQAWTITITVQNDRLKSYDNFPEITGFQKRGASTQSSTNIINGQISSTQSVIMTYVPTRQGIFTIPAFSMKVNEKAIQVPGKKVKVGAPVQQQQQHDPFRSFFDNGDDGGSDREFVDVKEDAFLALTTSKDQVYVGEGFNTTISFFVAEDNRAPLQFYELGKQLSDILKKVKPGNCWEENFNIENIEAESVTINGKGYSQYKIYQATLYPLNAEPVVFPAFDLKMIKYKVAKNPSFFGQNRKEDFKSFRTKQKSVAVKELPPHPLRDMVAVGDYRLDERSRNTNLETGASGVYEFNIYGEGNISAIEKPIVKKDGNFEFYEPNVRQDINRQKNRVTGTKSFSYFMIPKEPGEYKMKDYFYWVFFNPAKQKYDSLRPKLVFTVTGESKKNEAIQANDLGSFYDKIDAADNTLQPLADNRWQRWVFHAFIVVTLGAAAFIIFKKS
jgi:hypothetical protein